MIFLKLRLFTQAQALAYTKIIARAKLCHFPHFN